MYVYVDTARQIPDIDAYTKTLLPAQLYFPSVMQDTHEQTDTCTIRNICIYRGFACAMKDCGFLYIPAFLPWAP